MQTLNRPLDFFILFSSLSSVFGHAGQGNYAAGNAFLDALAHYRRALGLRGLTINWGYLGEVGYLARRQQLGERLERQGVLSFTLRQALALLERAMQRRAVQVSVMRVDWSRWRGLGVTGRVSPRFAHLLEQGERVGQEPSTLPTLAAVRAAEPGARAGLVDTLVRDKVARLLGASGDRLERDKPLINLGLDSLMAVELGNWLESELKVRLPIGSLMRSPSLASLTELLLEQIAPTQHREEGGRAESGAGQDRETCLPAETCPLTSDACFSLSEGQRGLWFLHHVDRTSAACNLAFAYRIRTDLDLPAFRNAVQALVDRHPSLRTTFEEREGELRQRVHEHVPVSLEVADASSWGEDELGARLAEEAQRPFDLERGPLVRMYLFARRPTDHVFLLSVHHLVGDFWSLVVVTEDMRALYPAARARTAPSLRPMTSRYSDFVRWQTELLASPEGERLDAYWERQLAGVPPVLDLPADRPRPPLFTHRGGAVPCRIEADLARRLRALAGREGVTLYTVLLASFQALLGRYTGQDDLVVGSPFASRSRPEFEGVAGYFINLLPLRADLSGDPTFAALLRRVGSTVVEALQHQDYPFPLIVRRLNLKRDSSRPPLVQVSFTLEKIHGPAKAEGGCLFGAQAAGPPQGRALPLEPYPVEQRTCQSDLELVLEEGGETIEGLLRYNADLFDPDTVRRMVGHFQTMLAGAAAGPDRRLSELPWLTESERRQVVCEWNDTRADYPSGLCLHQLFERQARKTPAAVALRFGEHSLSYAELDAWADRVAQRLRRLGVGPNVLGGLCLERSPEMVAGILATLKAGGAFVTLDPAGPPERLRALLADTGATVLLTQSGLRDWLPRLEAEVICLDHKDDASTPPTDHAPLPTAGDLAYVIYTSGSTGRPKGVMVEHRAICNTVLWRQQAMPVRPEDRVLLVHPYFFDASICSLCTTLAAGAALILPDPGEERNPARLLDRMAREEVTVLSATPGLLRLLLEGGVPPAWRALRWVCCGGEPMPAELPERLLDLAGAQLYNLYGPTEAAVDATWWACRRGEARPVIPIGRPIANVCVYILDSHRQPVPVGMPGELYIGGAGLARGYLNDPQLTAERFIPDPFREAPGARLYRTGDRGRWLPDGNLEFLGRLDQQVKVRGYRVEPGEVEAALSSAPAVREAAVAMSADAAGEQRLVGYVVSQPGETPPSAELLRRHLRERLPEYMVPAAFVLLPALPRTDTDKLDRRALPAGLNGRLPAGQPYVPARTALEEYLAGMWRDLLHVDRVGVEDNFFDLGGSSIQAALLINRLREKLGEPISTVAVFDTPTVAGLAGHLRRSCPDTVRRLFGPESLGEGNQANEAGRPTRSPWQPVTSSPGQLLVPLQPHGSRPPLFMVHPPGGIVVCYRALAQHLAGEQPLYGIQARGLHGEWEVPERLEDMAAEYVAAVRAVQPEGPYHLGGWSLGGVVALEMAQQLLAGGGSVGLLAFLDTTLPFGPANAKYREEGDELGREYGLDMTLEQLGRLGPEEQLPYLWQHVQRLGLVEPDTPLALVRQMLDDLKRLFHAHVRLASEYAVRPYPGRITLFRPSESPVAVSGRADRGWGRLAEGVDVHFVPGHHHTMVKEPHVQVLARELRACLGKAGAPLPLTR
jgi:amino acid adenylation domain-containing protein